MGSSGADGIPRGIEIGSSEANIEIKIKTLDSQTYTMIVDKQMPVPALKEQIASVTGVLSEQQRLICRGKVLKDDQLLSAYHVEDGHTLHMVVRQPVLPSPEGLTNNSATDPASGTSHGQMAPSFVIEAFTDQGEGVPPEISRFLSAILGSIGIPNFGIGSEGSDVARDHVPQRASTTGSAADTVQLQPPQAGGRGQSHGLHSAFGLPAAISLGSLHPGSLHSPPVISDSLTTLSQYLAHMKREFDAIVSGRGRENNAPADTTRAVHIDTNATSESSTTEARLPTPASLAEMLLSSRQVLIEQVAECLLQVARQIESQADVTDSAVRLSTQSSTWRTGVQLHNLGAFLLELGRTAMTLRLGQAPSDALVNAGPAVFINQSGPNPLMVQPLHFQSGTSFGSFHMGGGNPGAGLVNGIGSGFVPRRVDIQIRGSSAGAANNNREEHVQTQQPAGQANPVSASGSDNHANLTGSRVAEGSPFVGESGVRVVPIRTVIAAVPRSFGRLPSDSSGNSMGLYNPLLSRYQHGSAGLASGMRGSQGSGEHHSVGTRNEQHSTTEPTMQRLNVESRESDGNIIIEMFSGSVPTPNLREEPSFSRTININILSAGGTQNNQESDTQIPSSVMRLLRGLFPGGEIHVEGANLQGTTTNPVPENAGPSTGSAEPEPRVTDEGIFLSTLLREIMPLITQSGGAGARVSSQSAESSSETERVDVGSSRRPSDTEPGPNSKRQKME